MDKNLDARHQSAARNSVANVTPQLVDRTLELCIVESNKIERTHRVSFGNQSAC
jgi:hypothetical protein